VSYDVERERRRLAPSPPAPCFCPRPAGEVAAAARHGRLNSRDDRVLVVDHLWKTRKVLHEPISRVNTETNRDAQGTLHLHVKLLD
jgi:hypothetical protein